MKKFSDNKLMRLVLKRDNAALKVLYERYHKVMFNFIYRYTGNREIAEDLLQDTFLRVWHSSKLFKSEKGKFSSWIFKIALNVAKNEMIKKRHSYNYQAYESSSEADFNYNEQGSKPTHTLIESNDISEFVLRAIGKLNPYHREVIILKHYHDFKFREISAITNTPESTLKTRFQRAIEILSNELQHLE